ncbi:MAG TPA: hypothetical protein VMZ91_00840 [Candidatus Paceibacterota bacterium]|nr:hypothetical protein [Candidatus Paceibacterota bacterium]
MKKIINKIKLRIKRIKNTRAQFDSFFPFIEFYQKPIPPTQEELMKLALNKVRSVRRNNIEQRNRIFAQEFTQNRFNENTVNSWIKSTIKTRKEKETLKEMGNNEVFHKFKQFQLYNYIFGNEVENDLQNRRLIEVDGRMVYFYPTSLNPQSISNSTSTTYTTNISYSNCAGVSWSDL